MRSSSARTDDFSIDGHLEVLTSQVVSGWVECLGKDSKPVVVTARIGATTLFTVRASKLRADVDRGDGGHVCGFVGSIPADRLAAVKRRMSRDPAFRPSLDLFVHPVVGDSIRRAKHWRRVRFDECKHIFAADAQGCAPKPADANPFIGLIKRATAHTIGGWCACACASEARSRLAVSLYVDGLWVDTQFAVKPMLVGPVSEHLPRSVRGLPPVPLRFRFRTPQWMCDGREHEVAVAIAERPDWLVDVPRLVCLEDEERKADAFAMPPLQIDGGAGTGSADGPKRGEYEAWIKANQPARAVVQRPAGPLPGITALIETTGATDQAAIDETIASLRARSTKAREVILFGPMAGEEGLSLSDALARVSTEHLAMCRAGDRVAARAFETLGRSVLAHPDATLIFADDDVRDRTGRRRRPRFKTQYCPDRALTDTLFDGLTLVRKREALAALDDEPCPVDGRTLLLKVARRSAPEAIHHEPVVVCHRRLKPATEAAVLSQQQAAFVRSLLASEAAAARVEAPSVKPGGLPQVIWPRPAAAPTISVIMPTRDGAHLFEPLIDELLQDARSSDIALDILLIDNGSTSAGTHAAFVRVREKGVRVIAHNEPFNYSQLCNAGAAAARGDVLLFIHDDVIGVSRGLLDEMLRQALRPDLGAVGARLAFPDGTNQHCGVALGVGGVAAHLLKGHAHLGRADHGRFRHVQSVSAVTGALMAMRREAFEGVGGFDPALSVSHNDVDLCLRLARDLGLRTVYTPHARAYHLESQTRGVYLSAEERAKLAWEASFMRARWGDLLDHDPYVSPNHSRANGQLRPTLPAAPAPVSVAAE